MRAVCPRCGGDGRDGCDCDAGFVRVLMGHGDLYTRACRSCGRCNGGRLAGPEFPPLPPSPGPCVWCGSEDTFWEEVGRAESA